MTPRTTTRLGGAPRVARRVPTWLGATLPYLAFLALPLVLLWPVLWGGSTLVPFDALYGGLPWAAGAAEAGVAAPHNELLGDLVLQNIQWKSFAVERYREGALPLWQNRQLAGSPFLAAGQHSMLYPLSILFLLLPIPTAFGWFTLFSLALAGATTYLFARELGLGRGAATLAGLTFEGSGFLTISTVFPMIVAGAAWLPLLLAALNRIGRYAREEASAAPYLPWVGVGALAIGMAALAGHVEILYYTLLVGAAFAAWWLGRLALERRAAAVTRLTGWGLLLALGGALIGAAQLVPLYEMVAQNFRDGSAELAEVLGYAWPARQASSFVIPDLLGNPARHEVFDLVSRRVEPIQTLQPVDAAGNTAPLDHVAWFKGTPRWKNYVEGAGYLGLLPPLLLVAALPRLRRDPSLLFWPLLAGLSLLFIFGSPLYGLLFYVLPGFNQLHTPFRWIFPLTLAVAILAAHGWQALRDAAPDAARPARWLGGTAALAGGAGLVALTAIALAPGPWLRAADAVMARSQLTRWAFGESPSLLLSYQWENLLHLLLVLTAAGLLLLRAARRVTPRLALVAALLVALDLLGVARGFLPAVPTALAADTPPALSWLTERHEAGAWRYTVLEQDRKLFNANSTMRYGLEDVRGYDSIILKHYVDFMRAVAPQNQLDFNRVAPLSRYDPPPDQELLDLLNVRYLVTDGPLDWPLWRQVYVGEVEIYENQDVMPRAFLLGTAVALPSPPDLAALQALEPRRELLVEAPEDDVPLSTLPFTPVEVARYGPDEMVLEVAPEVGGWLVVSDVYFEGWRAFTRPDGAEEELRVPLRRANGAFRALWLEPGAQTVRLKYSPDSVKIGFFGSFLGVALLGLLGATWGWSRIYVAREDEDTARRVARNSVAPMALQLFNKGIDTVFAAFMARFLGPAALGQYAWAVALIWYLIIFSNFGLGTLLTRDAARDRDAAARLLNTTLILRAVLYAVALPLLVALLWLYQRSGGLEPETFAVVLLLALGLIPSNIADAVTAIFRAHERFEIPALVATIATFVKVSAGAGVLLAGYGIVGLAATSIVTNLVTLVILGMVMARSLLRPRLRLEGFAWRAMLHDAAPLMINEFLAVAFFRVDQLMLKPLRGESRGNIETGYYNVAFKFIDGLLILPSAFTLAIFPVMSRLARDRPDTLLATTRLSLRWLVVIALPIALLTTRYARPIVLAFGGEAYLPASAVALQILIWFLPFSFVNSLLQYVLIAADRQHALTRVYLWAVLFNVVANLFAIWRFGINGAATVTILSEIALLVPFDRLVRESIGSLPWGALLGRPAISAAVSALALWVLPLPLLFEIPLSLIFYGGGLLVLRVFGEEDRRLVARLLPASISRPRGPQ